MVKSFVDNSWDDKYHDGYSNQDDNALDDNDKDDIFLTLLQLCIL